MDSPITTSGVLSRVHALLSDLRLPLTDEKCLQQAIAEALDAHGIKHQAEYRLSVTDQVDFLLDGGVAVECKLKGSKRPIFRQLTRYANSAEVSAVLLVTNTAMGLPETIAGKPAYYLSLGSAWL
jgi:hypothetical protein